MTKCEVAERLYDDRDAVVRRKDSLHRYEASIDASIRSQEVDPVPAKVDLRIVWMLAYRAAKDYTDHVATPFMASWEARCNRHRKTCPMCSPKTAGP